jgi:ABC-type glycerol-3-phosphate transport system permease component
VNRLNASAVTWRVLVFILSLYFLVPLVWLIMSATKSTGQLFTTFGLWFALPMHLGANIRGMASFQSGVVGRWVLNTVIYSGGVAMLSTLFSSMAGYAFSRFEFPLKTLFNLMVLAAVLLPITALFSFVSTWNNFFLPLVVLSKGQLYPITLGLAIWNSTTQTGAHVDYPAILVGALISVLPLIVAFFTLQRYWQAGLTAGSVR